LSKLNRDLRHVICIDWDPAAVSAYPENTLLIKKWSGEDDDYSLVDLAELLKGACLCVL
jgi:TFIIF-interacting CTD phosphatase-like protein